MFVSKKVIFFSLLTILAITFFNVAPGYLEQQFNRIKPHEKSDISEQASALHQSLFIGDWHSDSLMWDRDLNALSDFGHVDVPRLQLGNVALQMFTTVTKSPSGLNYERNETQASDNITKIALVQLWPMATWSSLTQRAIHQADKLHEFIAENPTNMHFIDSKTSLQKFIDARISQPSLVGALLGTEGSHALDGELSNIQNLYAHGFRMMSLQHFFDNKLGGSLHGTSGAGLTEFGREAVQAMQALDIIVDISHSSEQVVRDVLALSTKPLVISHTGLYGHCQSPRNISDELMQQVAKAGGLIALGYWDGAVCDISPANVAAAIKYGVELVGAPHIALGSDFDGATEVAFDTSELVELTQKLLDVGLSESDVRLVMGENMQRFLLENLPD
ncbi:dipeptidase [Paraglaciecola hydrolytica]|uniref:Peptidase M19 n=1 Tax=Paraglaciecola hydrolytica TaxID=1799789 RepID=A0A148KKQ3_9ALTE|nr:dipeptidase [Paraglaciecola hydrolytica]KXI26894.1 peptidase M19 [Paraglaciecola hydrolytica]